MIKLWRVAAEEIKYYLRQWTFYLAALGIPLLFGAMGAIPEIQAATAQTPLSSVETILSQEVETFTIPTGYVDYAGLITVVPPEQADFFQAYPDEMSAQADLEAGEIESYYVIPADYAETLAVAQYTREAQLFSETENAFKQILEKNILAQLDNPALADRLVEPVVVVREGPEPQWLSFIPADTDWGVLGSASAILGLFAFTITFGGNLILRALQREVQADVLEMLMTSTTPGQFMGGKLVGLSILTFGQTGLTLLTVALIYGRNGEAAGPAALPLKGLALSLPYLFFGYLAFTGLMMAIASIWPNTRENAASLIILRLLVFAPVLGVMFVLPNPDKSIAVILTIFPLTSPLLMPFRLFISDVPFWQWLLGLLVGFGWAGLLLVISMRVFRANALLTGRAISLPAVWKAMTK